MRRTALSAMRSRGTRDAYSVLSRLRGGVNGRARDMEGRTGTRLDRGAGQALQRGRAAEGQLPAAARERSRAVETADGRSGVGRSRGVQGSTARLSDG